MTCDQASLWLKFFERRFLLLPDRPEIYHTWHALATSSRTVGLKSYDVRIVAAMQTYGIMSLLTFNASDFKGMGISILDPGAI